MRIVYLLITVLWLTPTLAKAYSCSNAFLDPSEQRKFDKRNSLKLSAESPWSKPLAQNVTPPKVTFGGLRDMLDADGGDLRAMLTLIKNFHPDWLPVYTIEEGGPTYDQSLRQAWNILFTELGSRGRITEFFKDANERQSFLLTAAAHRVDAPGTARSSLKTMSRSELMDLVDLWEVLERQFRRNVPRKQLDLVLYYQAAEYGNRNPDVLRRAGFTNAETAFIENLPQ